MSRKSKVEFEKKVRITREYLDGKISRKEAAVQMGTVPSAIDSFARIYRREGILGLQTSNQNRVYSLELRECAVQEYLAGGKSLDALCEKYKIRARTQLSNWIKVYNNHGEFNSAKFSGGGSYMKESRVTTQEERMQIVNDCIAAGRNYGEMALKYKVSYQQVRTWTLNYEKMGEAGLQDRRGQRKKDQIPRTELEQAQIEIEKLKHKLYLSEMENTLLKKLDEIERREASRKLSKDTSTR